jgi:hypothetical protein
MISFVKLYGIAQGLHDNWPRFSNTCSGEPGSTYIRVEPILQKERQHAEAN